MIQRRTFLLTAATVGAMSIIPGMAHGLSQLPSGDQTVSDNEFDFNGFYVAVSREFDGSITLSALINNRLKERKSFLVDDAAGITEFINMVGSARIVFIDWHGAPTDKGEIRAHEISIDWETESPMISLQQSFRECAALLSGPLEPTPR